MPDILAPTAEFVVGLRCRILEPEALYRVEATVQVFASGVSVYEEHVERFATWADAATWLAGLLSSTAAPMTVADHLSLLRGA